MGSAPYVSRLAKEMGERIAAGDRAMRRLKKMVEGRWEPTECGHCGHKGRFHKVIIEVDSHRDYPKSGVVYQCKGCKVLWNGEGDGEVVYD